MKANEQYFHLVLFVMLYKVGYKILNLWIKILTCDHSNECYWAVVVPFIMLYKLVLTFESVDEILKCDPLNESY